MASNRRGLELAPNLTIPLDAVTETFWWSGKRGSGKTHNCTVFVEELLRAGLQVVVIDPMRAWWGLRSSVDGKAAGFEVPIFGPPPRGDAPLESNAGTYMADLAMGERLSMILDIKDWSNADRRRFLAAFLARLLAKNSEPLHLVVEETPLFAPQRPQKGAETLLGIVDDVVRLGRGSGLGFSAISQRSAHLNAEVRAQIEVVVAHRTAAPLDRKAIHEWFVVHDPERVSEANKRLPFLPTGSAIVSSTDFLEFFGEVAFRPRTTFDSSATPRAGVSPREARTLADVDLTAIRKAMADAIEKAEANDPALLRRRIVELERQLRDPAGREAKEAIDRLERLYLEQKARAEDLERSPVKVPVLANGDRKVLEMLVEQLRRTADATTSTGSAIEAALARFDHLSITPPVRVTSAPPRARPVAKAARPAPRPDPPQGDGGPLGGGAPRKILGALVQHPEGLSARRAAALTGVSQSKSTLRNAVSSLRTAGYVDGSSDLLLATPAGFEAYGPVDPLPTGDELIAYWRGQLGGAPLMIFDSLLEVWPRVPDRDELAAMTGIDPTTSTMRNGLSKLRTLGLLGKGLELDEDLMAAVG